MIQRVQTKSQENMTNQLYKKTNRTLKLFLLFVLLVPVVVSAQSSPFKLSWDKTGCQDNNSSEILLDENLASIPCLQVCKGSSVTYTLTGEDIANIETISWYVEGGTPDYPSELSTLVRWNEIDDVGLIRITITLNGGAVISKVICINKINSELILNWDKIGCQDDENRVNEVKFGDNISDLPCLKVCKDSEITYGITGEQGANIASIEWSATGGIVMTPNERQTLIKWNNSASGSIRLRIFLTNETVVDQTICVQKDQSTLLFSWNKMVCQLDDSNLSEFKFDKDVLYAECLLVCHNDDSTYKISGYDMSKIQAIHWTVTGGHADFPDEKTTTISWDESEEGLIEIHLLLKDGTTATGTIYASKTIPGGGVLAPNSIAFDYDNAGNQTKRKIIYLPRRRHRQHLVPDSPMTVGENQLIPADEYKDLSYYPNPVNSQLYVKWSDQKGEDMQTMELYNVEGKLMHSYPNQSDKDNATVNFWEYPQGIYELKLMYRGGETKTLKIVKQ